MRRCSALATLCVLLFTLSTHAAQTPLTCPLDIAPGTLTMACSAACPDALSPCLYYPNASDCTAEPGSGSVCVASSSPLDSDDGCAIECFSPFGGSAWNLMITDNGEYKLDVAARRARDASFPLAKKSVVQLKAIRDLQFPATATTIAISGNALPILDKAVDYPVIYHGFAVAVDLQNFSFLENAQDATTIILENVNLTALSTFPMLPKLTALQLSNGDLRAIPSGIAKLPALERLEVSLSTLFTIPEGVLPTSLVDLCLQDCGLEELPPGIANMTTLKKLDLAGNRFALPPSGSLPLQVEHLIWWGFYHKALPPDLRDMTRLKKLEIGWNDFSNASALALLPPSLEELHLIFALLSELPPSLAALTNLTWIEMGMNSIPTVPTGTLPPTLRFLNLSINLISEIQAGALPRGLETLDLRLNSLDCSTLPTDLASLADLKALYLHENLLDCFPPAVFSLAKLETLTLHTNRLISRVTFNESEFAFLAQLKSFQIDQRSLDTTCESPAEIAGTNYTVCLTSDASIKNDTSPSGGSNSSSGSTTSDETGSNTGLIIGLAAAIGGLIVILIGAVHWKRRRDAANVVMQHPGENGHGHGGSGLKAVSVGDLFTIEEQHRDADGASDVTSYSDFTHVEARQRAAKSFELSLSSSSSSLLSSASSSQSVAQTSHGTKKNKVTMKTTTTRTTTATNQAGAGSTTSSVSSGSAGGAGRFSVWDDHELLKRRVDYAAIRDVQLLSSGMFGEVWLAIYMSRHVAVKRLKANPSSRGGAPLVDADLTASNHRAEILQFVQEIKLHSRMDHPKIVRLIGVAWTMESDIQAVLEYLPRGDLRSFLSSLQPQFEYLDDDDADADDHHWDNCAVQIALDIAEVLVYLHSLDPPVLHRDLKSRNVLLDETLKAKVTDFGASRYHFDDDTHVHMTTNMGTARWAAPEVLTSSEANYTSAIDVYSLGVVLSELDTWAVPFSEHVGVAESALLSQVVAGELQPRFRSSSPQAIVALAKRCIATDPKKRPTAVQVAFELRQLLATFPSGEERSLGLGSASRSSLSSSRSSMTAVGPAMAMSL